MSDQELQVDSEGRPRLDQFSEEGFVDCVFRIADLVTEPHAHRFSLEASYQGQRLGIDVTVRRGLRGGFDSEMELIREHVYRPAVRFVRNGEQSDRLLTVLAGLYGHEATALRMVEAIDFTGIVLHQDNVDMDTEPVRIKLFGRDSDEDIEQERYFESFFNLDLRAGLVFWNEKDPDYRRPLIQGLCATDCG